MPTSSLKSSNNNSKRKCVPHEPPIPAKFQGDMEKAKGAQVPEFTSLVNFPSLSQKEELPEGMRCCVMCGQTCPCISSNNSSNKKKNSKDATPPPPSALDNNNDGNKRRAASDNNFAIIPTQNKGLCKQCDVNVWVICQSGLQIKWCKGCKNFRPWAAFGDKGLATKCLRCRERQREHYALQKGEKEKAPTPTPTPTTSAATTTTPTTMTPKTPQENHLDWSNKQGRILTANGKALEYYTAERGFPFEPQELPHHHLGGKNNNTRLAFASCHVPKTSLVCGAWKRPLFCGEWEHSTEEDETAYNVQTNSLFVDLRIPTTRSQVLPADCTSLASLTNEQLAFYARQHVFGGLSKLNRERDRDVCTRLHCMDWNYVGTPRPRPNKWWIEMQPNNKNVWKEWAYATDNHGQHYYMERWERLEGGSPTVRLALRKADGGDGILVVVGDHFNYLLDRQLTGKEKLYGKSSLVDVVDAALAKNDRATAEAFLSIDAGHGFTNTSTTGWKIDAAIQPWKEGTTLISSHDDVSVVGNSLKDCHVLWNKERWDVYECSLKTTGELVSLLCSSKRR